MDDLAAFIEEAMAMKQQNLRNRTWWATYDPVAFLWLRRAERRGAIVPWSKA